jgi:hypothetical protein
VRNVFTGNPFGSCFDFLPEHVLETRTNDVPLLFKRQDFSKTDLASALPNS